MSAPSDLRYLLAKVKGMEAVVSAARCIGTEHSGMCVTVACSCTGHAKRRKELANALAALDKAEGETK
jgi:hypothetical protein